MNWPVIKLSELVEIRIGRTPSRSEAKYWGDGHNWLSIADMNQGERLSFTKESITQTAIDECKPNLATKGTVLFSFKLSIGKVGIAQRDLYHNEAIAALPIKDSSVLDTQFLIYALKNLDFIASTDRAVMGATLNKKKLAELSIPLPPLPVQKQIAAVLEKADNLRQQSQQMEEDLNSLAQSMFLDMFGDYRKDALSLKSSLGEVADVRSGVTKGQKLEGHKLTTVPYMRVANVQDGYLDLSEIKDITVKAKDFEKYQLKPGDVLMTEGGDFDKLGRGAIWPGQIANCIHQNHVFRVRLCDRYIPEFFAYYLQTPFVKQYFLKCAKKTTNLASINITQLKGLPIPDESLEKQQSFLRFIDELKVLKEANFEQQEQANAHFNSLMQRAFKGDLDLKDVA